MVPGEPYREEKDIDGPFPPGLCNRLQRGAEIEAGSGDTPTTAKPVDPTWGGGRWFFAVNKDGVASGVEWVIDDSLDYNNRFIIAFGYAFIVGNKAKLPGESAEPPAIQPDADIMFGQGVNPTCCSACMGYLKYELGGSHGRVLLHDNGSNPLQLGVNASGALRIFNNQATTWYPCIMYLVTDQFPTRT